MAALAYLLPPLTGLLAYLFGSSERLRWHGLQSIVLGVAWPAGLYAGALVTPGATQTIAAVGALLWASFLAAAAVGRDPRWPLVGSWLRRAAEDAPRAGPERG
jgi:uncharacterized membrane protein